MRRTPGRLPTSLLVCLLTCLAALGTVLAGPVAPAAAAPGDQTTSTAGPVQVTLSVLEPRTVTADSVIQVSGTLTNAGDDTITDVSVRLQRGDRLTSRQALAEDAARPSAGTTAQAPFLPQSGVLDPGDDIPFAYSTTAAELGITAAGVYPVLVNVNGTRGGLVERVGELPTYLVAPGAPTTPTSVAWLWPLTDRPHRDAAGRFTDDDLAAELSADGRLDRALQVLEDLPDGGRGVPVTLAVDPALVQELTAMAGGYTVDGVAGAGVAAAATWLDRLRALAAVHPVLALPYADVDADALQSAGLSDVVLRALPGTPAGGGAGEEGADGEGARILADALDTQPRTDLVWPAGGVLRADTLATLQAAGVDQLVLAQGAYTDSDAAVGRTGRAAAARVPVDTAAGQLTTLVADTALGDVVAGADTAPGGARAAEQRYLAELGVLTDQLAAVDPAVAQTVLVVPPREVEADPSWATPMLADTVTQTWLAGASLTDLAAGPSAEAGTLVAPTDTTVLAGEGLVALARADAVRADLAAAVGDEAGDVLAEQDDAIARASSTAWRGDPAGFAAAAADVEQTIDGLRGQVGLVVPADGTYSLASSDAPLVLTVRNDLPFAVTVVLDLRARSGVGFTAGDVPPQRLEANSRTVVTVPTTVRQSGGFTVVARLTTPAGGVLGSEVELRVTSTAYGPITLAITIGAAALLGLLFLRRLVLFVLRRRRGEARPVDDDVLVPADGGPDADHPAPTTRSPV
ncbi:hypothetical protein SAMN03159343_3875 [Klenkia marina]|uniref:Glycoprotein n=1 Tax=Klenkia marina TaxID=1960309 RepID=A0A1G4Z184_9ACTN|nr:DUF6049 family protein [Klenkia marina]SCX58998.1 hypothetical protein SAMN03159343_3875 [Klenkia marina]